MNLKNAEGYPDPTAGIALANVAKTEKSARDYWPLVYIASPYAGDTEYNISRAKGYCRFAMSRGYIPLAPHLHYPQFMDDSDREERDLGLFFCSILLTKCHEVWAFGDRVSDGMSREIAKAKRRGIPVRYFNTKCEEESTNDGSDKNLRLQSQDGQEV